MYSTYMLILKYNLHLHLHLHICTDIYVNHVYVYMYVTNLYPYKTDILHIWYINICINLLNFVTLIRVF